MFARNRLLEDESDVFKYNAWDNMQWGETEEKRAQAAIAENSEILMTSDQLQKIEKDSAHNWDKFYSNHQNKFFKNRSWLFCEFSELNSEMESVKERMTQNDGGESSQNQSQRLQTASNANKESYTGASFSRKILEIGCGVGNTIFPLLNTNKDPNMFVYGADFSREAINIVQNHSDYDSKRCLAFVLDVTDSEWVVPFPANALDIITCIFVLSAINPNQHQHIVNEAARYLKPGGLLLFRDYGRYDMTQLRFKSGRCLGENYYARGDGTKSYFFTKEEIQNLCSNAGLKEKEIIVDRRLQVNRGKRISMYRIWIQGKFIKE